MTTTYKLLKQHFLERNDGQTTTSSGGYYYGLGGGESTTTDDDTFNNRFNTIELDERFNPNLNDAISEIALQSDGKILIGGGFTTLGGVTRNRIARLNSDGTLDTGFNPDANNGVGSIALQSDNKIIIGGNFTTVGGVTRNRIARLNSDGTLDTGFNPDANNSIISTAIQSDGKILIVGYFTTVGGVVRNYIAKLNSDGTLDTGFNPNVNSTVFSIATQLDGKILIGGGFTTIGGVTRNNIARLNSDGTVDTGFNPNANSNIDVTSIAIQPDNKIIIGGFFNTVGGVTRNRIARLKEIVDNAPYKLIYTVPSNTSVILGSIFTTNHNEFPAFYDIAVVPYADTNISEKHYYIWDNLLEDNNFEVLKDKLTLSAGDKIYVYSSTYENISFNIFGTEITV